MGYYFSDYTLVEKLNESRHTEVYKAYSNKNPSRLLALKILKNIALSKNQKSHFRQKIEQLKVLHDPLLIPPLSFDIKDGVPVIIQAYFAGTPLDQWAGKQGPIDLPIFFDIACTLAQALDRIHEAGIIHGGIKPRNVLINDATRNVRVIDFITPLDVRDVSHFVYDRSFVKGTLAYTSPEQTGRISTRVDFTTDLYSLGIIFYELLTSRLPFFSLDPLELIHSHLAEEALPVHKINPAVPAMLSQIIAKLTRKQPEKRYQSGSGLLADLSLCKDEYGVSGKVEKFHLGLFDQTHRVIFVSKMVGRQNESKTILAEYDHVTQGNFRSLFISGLSGIGKTRLIQELQRPIVEHRGYFSSGKFDVYQKNIPYSSLIQAFRNLIRALLTESNERVDVWKQRILQSVGSNGRVITNVLPELEILLGPQPEVRELPPIEARNRFLNVFGRFLTSLAGKENPLVLFIDDLQWCDGASFDFLADIFSNFSEHPYLLLIGAYRHNEVDSSHPLTKLIQAARQHSYPLREIRLEPIKEEHCHEMVSYILDSPAVHTESLALFIASLSEGNPLYVSESLSFLYNENLLFLDKERHWQWDLEKIHQSDMPSTVVALFSSKVQKMPVATIDLLEYCVCMGNMFTPDDIALVKKISLLETFQSLKPALNHGLLIENKSQLQFVHDRVQEAVLSKIQQERRRQIHWQIGSHLFAGIPAGVDLEKLDNLFTVTSHLNLGREKILGRETADRLANLNYHAGNKALNALATEAANEFFRQSLELLPADSWEVVYERTYRIYQKLAKSELMCGNYENSEMLLNQLLNHAKSDLDKAEALAEQTTSLSSIGNFIKAIETANRGLAIFEKAIPDDPESANKKRQELFAEIKTMDIDIWDTILHMPFTEERKSKIELAFYSELIPDLYMSGLVPQLYLAAVRSTKHCLAGGMDESVIYSFSIMGLHKGEQGEFAEAFKYEDLACNLSAKYPNTFGATRGMNGVVWCNMHSRSHPEDIVQYCLKAIQCGKNCGDLYNAGLAYGPLMWNLQVLGADLERIEEYAQECLQFSQKYHLSFSTGLAEAMLAGWIEPMKKEFKPMPIEEKIRQWEKDNHISSAGSYYVHLGLSSYYCGEYEEAEHHLQEVRRYLHGLTDNVLKRQWYVFQVLNALKLHEQRITYENQDELLAFIRPLITNLETWAQLGPLLRPYLAFVHAEMERVLGDSQKVYSLYLEAIDHADRQRYTFLSGYLHECLGELLHEGGPGTARLFFHEADRLYGKCRAERKGLALQKKYPSYFEEEATVFAREEIAPMSSFTLPSLDLDYLMKSSLAISAEIAPDILLKKIMNVVLEASGAQYGAILIKEDGDLLVRAESRIEEKDLVRNVRNSLNDTANICKSIVRYVQRTHTRVILNNAMEEEDFKDNLEVQSMELRSVLCLPLIKQSRLTGILYLENRLANSVFTSDKAEMIELLSSQAAISLENAALVEEATRSREQIRDQKRFLERVIESLTDPFIVIDAYTRQVTLANKAALKERDLDHMTCHALLHDKETACDENECPLEKLKEIGKPVVMEHVSHRENGEPVFTEVSGYPIFDDDGHIVQMVEYCIDITERKCSEKEIKKYAETQSVLLREINHRVKNNLTAIIGMLQMEQKRFQFKDYPACGEVLHSLIERIESLAIVHSLLTAHNWQPLRLSDLCEKVISGSLQGLSSDKTISVNIKASTIKISTNQAHHLTLVLNELATNTIKYGETNQHVVQVSVEIQKEKNMVRLIYKDSGTGYPGEILKDDFIPKTVGIDIIQGIIRKNLGGEVRFKNDNGAMAIMTFIIEKLENREVQ